MQAPDVCITGIHSAGVGIDTGCVYREEGAPFHRVTNVRRTRLSVATGGTFRSKYAFIVNAGVHGASYTIITC